MKSNNKIYQRCYLQNFCLLFLICLISNSNIRCQEDHCEEIFEPEKIGVEFQINTFASNAQDLPTLEPISKSCGNDKEKFVVVWESRGSYDNSTYGIYAQMFNSTDGTKIGLEFEVNDIIDCDQKNPSISSIGAKCQKDKEKFVVTWESHAPVDGSTCVIYAQMFNSTDGTKIGQKLELHSNEYSYETNPSICSIGKDRDKFVITWQGNTTENGYGIFAVVLDSTDGTTLDDVFQVDGEIKYDQTNPSICSIGKDRDKFVITWEGNGQDSEGVDIFAQVFNSTDGTEIGSVFQVNNYTTEDQLKPSISSIGNVRDKFVITWQSYIQDGSGYGIFAQIFNSIDHGKIGAEFQVNTYTSYNQQNPSVSSIQTLDVDGDAIEEYRDTFVIVWDSHHGVTLKEEINGQIYDYQTGKALLPEDFLINNYTENKQYVPQVASISESGDNNKFLVIWSGKEQDDDFMDIFGQIYTSKFKCKCKKGHFSNSTTPNQCPKCQAGTYQDLEWQTKCENCPTGNYQNLEGSISCVKCPKGHYQKLEGQPICEKCPAGQYQDLEGQPKCENCPTGNYQNLEGSSSCLKCPKGHYQDLEGQSNCEICLNGTYQNLEAQTQCENCTVGNYQDAGGSSSCSLCPKGQYQNLEGQSECLKCPQGTYNDNEEGGSASILDCHTCDIGAYNDLEGQSTCLLCPAGAFNTHRGSIGCIDCPIGYYQDQRGQSECHACTAGKYQNEEGANNCQTCYFNKYQNDTAQSTCLYCPMNSETLLRGTKTIDECFCSIGYYGLPGALCQKCPESNAICDTFNQHYPKPKPGFWNSESNPFEIIKCQAFEACPGYGINKCNESLGYSGYKCSECRANFYKLDSRCEQCPDNAKTRFFLIAICFFFLLLFFLFIAKKATSYFGSFTISFSFFQILVIIYDLNIKWPNQIESTLKFFLPFNFNLDFLATECSFNLNYFDKWIIIQLFPFLFLLTLILIYSLLFLHSKLLSTLHHQNNDKKNNDQNQNDHNNDNNNIYNNNFFMTGFIFKKFPKLIYKPSKKLDNIFMYYFHLIKYYLLLPFFQCFSKQELKNLKNIMINVYLTLLTLLYLILSQKSLQVFDCAYDSSSKNYVFQPEPNYNCFEKWWYQFLPFSIISIVLYIIGIPILIVYLLIKNSKILTERQFDLKFGLLCTRYNKNFFFWEIVIMIRKLFLVISQIYLYNYTVLQLIAMILILLLALIIQFRFKPYIESRHNFLESILLFISNVILFAGLVFYSNELDLYSNNNNLITVLMFIIIFAVFLLLFITFLDVANKIKVSKRTKGDYNKKKLNQLNMFNNNSFFHNLLDKNQSKDNNKKELNLSLLLYWLSSLNDSNLEKLSLLMDKIIHYEVDFHKLKDQNKNGSKYDGKKQKKIYKFHKLKNQKFPIFKHLFSNDLIIEFLKWYNKKASLSKKIQIIFLMKNFNSYLLNNLNNINIKKNSIFYKK
ncbi:insulin-like growth factor binding protein [Anaeramoeba flamelloides]|uniref:Insulin-like growth factor binding protein n=1 Tax=Anaeramoeba flamelloides TaxID=1746091 RepID=A0ABQ8YYV5_9EUKA|nr:insulin-like growth factor binding protein [Anaeramoeba flamelloides]